MRVPSSHLYDAGCGGQECWSVEERPLASGDNSPYMNLMSLCGGWAHLFKSQLSPLWNGSSPSACLGQLLLGFIALVENTGHRPWCTVTSR